MGRPDLIYAVAFEPRRFGRGAKVPSPKERGIALAQAFLQTLYLVHSLLLAGVDPKRIVVQVARGVSADVVAHFRRLCYHVQEGFAPNDAWARLRSLLAFETDGYACLPSGTLVIGPLSGFFDEKAVRIFEPRKGGDKWLSSPFVIPRSLARRLSAKGAAAPTARQIQRVPVDYVHSTGDTIPKKTKSPIPISLLMYRAQVLDSRAKFIFKTRDQPRLTDTLCAANAVVRAAFDNAVFWRWRFATHAKVGAGRGTHGKALKTKQAILRALDITAVPSVLDVGCGDLTVVSGMPLRKYVGADACPEALAAAKRKRPKWQFILLGGSAQLPSAHTVLCFEVLIHQRTRADYDRLMALLCEKTEQRLIVSGHARKPPIGSTITRSSTMSRWRSRCGTPDGSNPSGTSASTPP